MYGSNYIFVKFFLFRIKRLQSIVCPPFPCLAVARGRILGKSALDLQGSGPHAVPMTETGTDIFSALGSSAVKTEEAEVKLDLCGVEKQVALQRLDTIVRYCRKSGAASLYVGFDPARAGAGETLFQPVMRYFKFEKLNGYVRRAVPVMTADSAGVFVFFKV